MGGFGRRSVNRHDPEIIECHNEDCQKQFDLARQNYYSPYCPTCYGKEKSKGNL